jgi:single-strand DNA-binding protein
MQMNRVVIAGYIAKKPEIRHLPSGTPVAHVRLGETSRYLDAGGESREQTNWHSLSFYGALADTARTLDKGDNVYIDGRIEQREFTPKDGSRRIVNEIVVIQFHMIAPLRSGNESIQEPSISGGAVDDDWPVAG